jgi:LmbE family N-acetylglucosaminyl deacetylase
MTPGNDWICWSPCQAETLATFLASPDDQRRPPPTAVVVAHPDDETAGAGGRLKRLRKALFVYTTDGSPMCLTDARQAGYSSRHDYAQARQAELGAALGGLGISSRQIRYLGCIDQLSAYHLVTLIQSIKQLLASGDYALVLTHPYEGGHPDHDTAALAVQAACRLLQREGRRIPVPVEITSYHLNGNSIRIGEFLPSSGRGEFTIPLSPDQQLEKRRLLDLFVSQRKVLAAFPVERERFRIAPRYDFAQPPHPGPLLYERFQWRMTGARWRSLAIGALDQFGLSPSLDA